MKTEIGEIPDSFITKIRTINGTKYIRIPKDVSIVGDYNEGDIIRTWIKKIIED